MAAQHGRTLMLFVASAASAVAGESDAGPPAVAERDARPNVVLIFADDLGYGDLGCYGHPVFKTPQIDRMAAEGVRLTQFYAPTPYCAPSRGTILTGRYPWRHGVMRNPTPDAGINDVGLPDSEVTLAEVLKRAGYATACIGKWHLGHRPEFYPTRHGFDEYLGILYSNDMRPVELVASAGWAEPGGERRGGGAGRNETAPAGLGLAGELRVIEYPVVQATLTKRYTERAIDFIEQNRERPLFLYLPHAMPHKPLACSEEFYKQSGGGLYADVMAELDWSIGQILGALKEHGLDEQTLVIFTSDNGPWFGGSTGGLRGMKGNTWEGGIRVPCVARWPGRLPAGRTVAEPCGSIDVFPTVLEACGVAVAEDNPPLDGRNLLPVLRGESPTPHEAQYAMQGGRLRTVRSGRWKLHVELPGPRRDRLEAEGWVDPRGPDGVTILAPDEQYGPDAYPGVTTGDAEQRMMLFDLETDAAEQHNVADEHPEVVRRLKERFDQMNASVPRADAPDGGRRDADTGAGRGRR